MNTSTRFELRLSPAQRQELNALAQDTGLANADLARLAIKQFLERPEILGLRQSSRGVSAR